MQQTRDDSLTQSSRSIPTAYLQGWAWFCGKRIKVNKDVLIPRADTEVLVDVVKNIIADCSNVRVLDMCTGSGAVAIALSEFAMVEGCDVCEKALAVARMNGVNCFQSDMFSNVTKKYDIIVCNPPYIKTNEIGLEDPGILHEPRKALDGGEDGLEFYRILSAKAEKFCDTLVLEIGYNQAKEVVNLLENNNWCNILVYEDMAGRDRVICAERARKN